MYDGSANTAADAFESSIASTSSAGPAHGPREIVKPEILAPAGGWPQMRAAVEAGADAVYFGLNLLNARARAANFDVEELPEVMSFLHARGARGFVTMNVLVFDEELAQAEGLVRSIAKAGVDAVIVQDVGLVNLVRETAPGLTIHGSTQMSITSPEGAEFARELGCRRVVVGRELSVREIAAVRQGTEAEVEAFVHGALCVSYSGQCFSSEAWGGRSANRGQCAQACRLPYGLVVDGALREMGDVEVPAVATGPDGGGDGALAHRRGRGLLQDRGQAERPGVRRAHGFRVPKGARRGVGGEGNETGAFVACRTRF